MQTPFFTGPFAPMCEKFVAQQQAVGKKYETAARRLRQFDDFAKDFNVVNYQITDDLFKAYCQKRPSENDNSRRDRIYIVWTFAEYLSSQGFICSCIPPDKPKSVAPHTPYIFTMHELKSLFDYLDGLGENNLSTSNIMFPILFRILYGCGLRKSEVLNLKKEDVDVANGIIHVNRGKNDRERIVVMSVSLQKRCAGFLEKYHSNTPEGTPFLYTKSMGQLSESTVNRGFRSALWDIGIPYYGKDKGPRVHDLRHTFICHNIQKWAESGVPIHSKLPVLSKYVGHSHVKATHWYIRLTAETYPHIRQICEEALSGIYSDILIQWEDQEK